MNGRKIIHVDMDAFYASIEQRDFPELRGKPVIVGGDPHSRGVVATASYEARKYGIRSAMACSHACRLCPHVIFVRPRFDVYKHVSGQLHKIFKQYTDLVEPLALDEAYLDVTVNKAAEPSATRLAQRILQQIYEETRLTASAGVSFNKFLAKLASGWKKPCGLTVITPKEASFFVEALPIGKFYGVGKATEKKMLALGIRTGKDLKEYGLENLRARFGKIGAFFHQLAHCQDERPVNPSRVRKSLGKETTFERDIVEKRLLEEQLSILCEQVAKELAKKRLQGKTVTVKVRYSSFKTVTRSRTLEVPVSCAPVIFEMASGLLTSTDAGTLPIRLLGVSISNLQSS